jgi:hypothetical protein
MIFKAKDAGVNRKRKPLTLYYCQVCMGKTNNQQGYKFRKKYETIVEEIGLQLTQVM